MQRLTLVPGHVWPKFDDFAAGRHPQTFGPPESAHRRNHVVDVFRIDIAVVHSDGKALVLHQYSRDIAEVFRQSSGGMRQSGDRRAGRGILVMAAIRCDQLEAVTAREPQSVDVDPVADIGQVTAADHPHRALCCQRSQRLGATVQQGCGSGVFDYVGQRAVEVEEHHWSPSRNQFFQLAVDLQSIGEGRHGGVTASHRELSEVGYHGVGSAGQQFVGVPVPVETDNEAESACTARCHTELRRARSPHSDRDGHPGDVAVSIRTAGSSFTAGVSFGDSHADEFVDARGVQNLAQFRPQE